MRALGIESDKEIIKYCLLDMERNKSYIDLFIPSIHDATKIFTQDTAIEFIATFTKGKTVAHALEILTNYLLPHIGEMNFKDKAYFIGHMVKEMLFVFTGDVKPTDRDNFRFKRIEQTGTLIYDLFREYYLIQKKDISRRIDEEYYYHRGNYREEEATEMDKKQQQQKIKKMGEKNSNKYKDNSFISLVTIKFIRRKTNRNIIFFGQNKMMLLYIRLGLKRSLAIHHIHHILKLLFT
jgi:DNA-directed RNA polymerase beta subunit